MEPLINLVHRYRGRATAIFGVAAYALIGELSNKGFGWIFEWSWPFIRSIGWYWLPIALALALGIFVGRHRSPDRGKVEVLTKTVALDDTLFRLLPAAMSSDHGHEAVERWLTEFIHDCGDIIGDDFRRGMVLLPDESTTYLAPKASVGMPEETLQKRFYIGSDQLIQRGCAGEVYRTGKLMIVHMHKVDGKWIADKRSYIPDAKGRNPQYRAFAAIPIRWKTNQVFGVLCLDSSNPDVFDPLHVQELLSMMGQRLAAAFLLQPYWEEQSSIALPVTLRGESARDDKNHHAISDTITERETGPPGPSY